MKTLNQQELKSIEQFFQLTQPQLLKAMKHYLGTKYEKVIATKEYLDKELSDGTLFEVKTEPELPTRYIGVMYLKHKILSKCSQEFLAMLNEKK